MSSLADIEFDSDVNSAIEEITDTRIQDPYKVIVFNDSIHTFDEVIHQIMKATGCDGDTAQTRTMEIHNDGKSAVFSGEMIECIRVSSILEEIALHTQIEG